MEFKKPNFPFFFKRLNRKSTGRRGGGYDGASGGAGNSGRWRFKSFSPGLRRNGRFTLRLWFIDGFLFKIVSVLEAVILVATLCFFYLCCGCHIWSDCGLQDFFSSFFSLSYFFFFFLLRNPRKKVNCSPFCTIFYFFSFIMGWVLNKVCNGLLSSFSFSFSLLPCKCLVELFFF